MTRRRCLVAFGAAGLALIVGGGAAFAAPTTEITGVISDELRVQIIPAFEALTKPMPQLKTFATLREAGDGIVQTLTFTGLYSPELLPKIIPVLSNHLQEAAPLSFQIAKPTKKPADGADDFIITDVSKGISAHITRSKRGNFRIIFRYKTR